MGTHPYGRQVKLTGTPATLLITLYAKALDYRAKKSVLYDATADQLVRQIDYDFATLDNSGNRAAIPLRAKQYDVWLAEFLTSHPQAVVLNLGCSLDTRITRINPPFGVHWFDIDYPDVIALRKRFYTESQQYRMLATSLTDPAWLAVIPRNRPVIIIAEGVFEYLTAGDIQTLLQRLINRFGHGQLLFDVMNSFVTRAGSAQLKAATGAALTWSVDDIQEADTLNPHLTRLDCLPLFNLPYVKQLPWKLRLLCHLMNRNPNTQDMIRLLRYRF